MGLEEGSEHASRLRALTLTGALSGTAPLPPSESPGSSSCAGRTRSPVGSRLSGPLEALSRRATAAVGFLHGVLHGVFAWSFSKITKSAH